MKTFIQFILLCFLISCSITKSIEKKNITGKYTLHKFFEIGSTLELNEDSSFIYDWQLGLMNGITTGYWSIKGRKLVLNSVLQPNDKEIELVKFEKRNSDSILIKIVDIQNEGIPFVVCFLKKDTSYVSIRKTDYDGYVTLPRINDVDSLMFKFVEKDKKINFKLDFSNSYFEFKTRENMRYYEYFTNKVLIIKNDKLYDRDIRKSKYVYNNHYKKTNLTK